MQWSFPYSDPMYYTMYTCIAVLSYNNASYNKSMKTGVNLHVPKHRSNLNAYMYYNNSCMKLYYWYTLQFITGIESKVPRVALKNLADLILIDNGPAILIGLLGSDIL